MNSVFYKYLIFLTFFRSSYIRANWLVGFNGLEFATIGIGLLFYVLSFRQIEMKRLGAIFALFAWYFVSFFLSKNEYPTSYYSSNLMTLIGSFATGLFFFTKPINSTIFNALLKAFVYGIVVAAITQILYSIFPFLALERTIGSTGRVQLGALNANELAIVDVVAIAIVLFCDVIRQKILKLIFLAILLYSLLLTGSRTGVICLGCVFLCYLFSSKTNILGKVLIISLIAVLLYYIAITFMPPEITDRLLSIGQSPSKEDEDGMSGRSTIWASAFQLWASISILKFLFGFGFNSFMYVVAVGFDAHNVYIKVLLELGVVGAIVLIGVIVNRFRYGRNVRSKVVYYSLLAAIALSFMTLSWYYYSIVMILWSFLYNFKYFADEQK